MSPISAADKTRQY